jgi:uncharacterized protein (TIGR01777 family)
VTVSGAGGLIGRTLLALLVERSAEVTVLARDPERTMGALRASLPEPALTAVRALAWQPLSEPAPADALAGRDAVVHLAGETIAQRWTRAARRRILESREVGTRNLVGGLRAAALRTPDAPPPALVSASAVGYYGDHGEEPLDEDTPAGSDFLAAVCNAWEAAAAMAERHGSRVALLRIGVVLDPGGGARAAWLPPSRPGGGGGGGRGRQYVSWIHPQDLAGLFLRAIEDETWSGAFNATAPQPVTNAQLARALGRVLGRPAALPIPALALRLRYGAMASLLTAGARVLPARALVAGFPFGHPEVEGALRDVLGKGEAPSGGESADPADS